MEKNTNKPSIRFAEFTDAWEQRKLKDETSVITKQTGFDYSSTIKPSLVTEKNNDNYPFIQNKDFDGKSINYNTDFYIPISVAHKFPKITLDSPSLLITISGKIGNIGYFNDKTNAFIGGAVGICKLKNDNGSFITYSLLSSRGQRHFNSLVKASSHSNITIEDIRNIEYLCPSDNNEKLKIVKLFDNLDHLITLHQRKCDQLGNIKKALLEKMFPSQNEYTPRIRFKCFTDAWEQRKLGDVVQITMGQSPDGSTYSDEPSDYILVQGNADLQNGWVCPRIWTTQITKKADAGDLIMSVRAPAGAMGKTAYNAVIGRGVAAIKGNEFIYQLLVKMDTDGFWKTLSCGSTFESLNSDNIKNAEVKIPTTAEQIKIGGLFQYLDNLITLHQRKCEKLKNIKKSLLEKMFA